MLLKFFLFINNNINTMKTFFIKVEKTEKTLEEKMKDFFKKKYPESKGFLFFIIDNNGQHTCMYESFFSRLFFKNIKEFIFLCNNKNYQKFSTDSIQNYEEIFKQKNFAKLIYLIHFMQEETKYFLPKNEKIYINTIIQDNLSFIIQIQNKFSFLKQLYNENLLKENKKILMEFHLKNLKIPLDEYSNISLNSIISFNFNENNSLFENLIYLYKENIKEKSIYKLLYIINQKFFILEIKKNIEEYFQKLNIINIEENQENLKEIRTYFLDQKEKIKEINFKYNFLIIKYVYYKIKKKIENFEKDFKSSEIENKKFILNKNLNQILNKIKNIIFNYKTIFYKNQNSCEEDFSQLKEQIFKKKFLKEIKSFLKENNIYLNNFLKKNLYFSSAQSLSFNLLKCIREKNFNHIKHFVEIPIEKIFEKLMNQENEIKIKFEEYKKKKNIESFIFLVSYLCKYCRFKFGYMNYSDFGNVYVYTRIKRQTEYANSIQIKGDYNHAVFSFFVFLDSKKANLVKYTLDTIENFLKKNKINNEIFDFFYSIERINYNNLNYNQNNQKYKTNKNYISESRILSLIL